MDTQRAGGARPEGPCTGHRGLPFAGVQGSAIRGAEEQRPGIYAAGVTDEHEDDGRFLFDEPERDRWRASGADALATAGLARGAGHHAWACFLSEQAAQLALKGLLHGLGAGDRARGHGLPELGAAAEIAMDETLPENVSHALRRLARHYLPARYPDALPGGTPADYFDAEDATQAVEDAEAATAWCAERWVAAAGEASPPSGAEPEVDG